MSTSVALIDYGSGNLHSVAKALEHVGSNTGHVVEVTHDPTVVRQASHIVLPGVGAFGDCVAGLKAMDGMMEALQEAVQIRQKPFFGICVGMQMLAEKGLEKGEHRGLGWIKGTVEKLQGTGHMRIPHMGWNNLHLEQSDHPAVKGIKEGEHAYFVHSYHMDVEESGVVVATTDYGQHVTAMVAKENIIATQFHPEKSQAMGLRIIENFLKL